MSQITPDAWIERNESDPRDPYFRGGGEPDPIFTEPCAKCGEPSNPDESNLEDDNWTCTNCISKLLASLPCGYSAEYDQGRFNLYRGAELLFVGLGFKELEEKSLGLETQMPQTKSSEETGKHFMSPEKQRIAIAEACGRKDIQNVPIGLMGYNDTLKPSTQIEDGWITQTAGKRYYRIPNYLSDLNAMHEAEKVLSETQYQQYCDHLVLIEPRDGMAYSASAAQRAEALLRTLNLWTESHKEAKSTPLTPVDT